MNGQSDRRRPTYLESGVFHSDATYSQGQANAADDRDPVALRGRRDQRP